MSLHTQISEESQIESVDLPLFPSSDPIDEDKVFEDIEKGIYLYHSDCLLLMDTMISKYPNGYFDMIFADPPYFLSNGGITCQNGKMVLVDKGKWDRSKGVELNHQFNYEWLKRCQALLKPNGTIWVSGTMHVIFSIGYAMQKLRFKLLNDIAWIKPNPPPNLACRYFTHSSETILWAAKNKKSKHYFDYQLMKNLNDGKQMRSDWSFLPPSKNEKVFGKHPTQKPISLIERCIMASTKPADTILDPFAGSSTTGVAAVKNKRKFHGIEIDKDYIFISIKRLRWLLDNETRP
jgi:site-specific DNA-methyltransferase (adenine-specific)